MELTFSFSDIKITIWSKQKKPNQKKKGKTPTKPKISADLLNRKEAVLFTLTVLSHIPENKDKVEIFLGISKNEAPNLVGD